MTGRKREQRFLEEVENKISLQLPDPVLPQGIRQVKYQISLGVLSYFASMAFVGHREVTILSHSVRWRSSACWPNVLRCALVPGQSCNEQRQGGDI